MNGVTFSRMTPVFLVSVDSREYLKNFRTYASWLFFVLPSQLVQQKSRSRLIFHLVGCQNVGCDTRIWQWVESFTYAMMRWHWQCAVSEIQEICAAAFVYEKADVGCLKSTNVWSIYIWQNTSTCAADHQIPRAQLLKLVQKLLFRLATIFSACEDSWVLNIKTQKRSYERQNKVIINRTN